MGKKLRFVKNDAPKKETTGAAEIVTMESLIASRADLINRMIDPPARDINKECGYPDVIDARHYRAVYDRVGLGKRVVNVMPNECWKTPPEIYESEESMKKKTPFDEAFEGLNKKHQVLAHLNNADIVSGIGRFGIILLGIDDGEDLSTPAAGFDDDGTPSKKTPKGVKLLYIRELDEAVVTIDTREENASSPRYGKPIMYSVMFEEDNSAVSGIRLSRTRIVTTKVHWTRVIHVAEGCDRSLIFGTPRMQACYDRILDGRKILGSSGEGYWKGSIPGIAIEANPDVVKALTEAQRQAIKDEVSNFQNTLQRFISVVGATVKPLAPTVTDPTPQYEACITDICITLGIPVRIFKGSERGELSSSQDAEAWNERLAHRQGTYISPMIIYPTVMRLIQLGILPPTSKRDMDGDFMFEIFWTDLNKTTDADKANVSKVNTDALVAYANSEAPSVIPPNEYLTRIMGFEPDEVEEINKAEDDYQGEIQQDAALNPPPVPPVADPNATVPPTPPQNGKAPVPPVAAPPVPAPKKSNAAK